MDGGRVHVIIVAALAGMLVVPGAAVAMADSTSPHAQSVTNTDDLDRAVDKYNENLDRVPDSMQRLLAGERVAVRVTSPDGTQLYYFETDNQGRVTDHGTGAPPGGPTVRVTTSEATVDRVADADDPVRAGLSAYNDGEVRVRGVGFLNQIEVAFAKSLIEGFSDVVDSSGVSLS